MVTRFTVEPREGGFAVRDNTPPKGSPYKDGLIYISSSEKLANEHAKHCNMSTLEGKSA